MRRLVVLLGLIGVLTLLLGCSSTRSYTVQSGDTLQGIALKNNTTVAAIIQLNKDRYPSLETNPRTLGAGWEIEIPGDTDVAIEIESLLMRIARNANPPTTPAPAVAAAPNDKINRVVQQIFAGINQARLEKNLKPLSTDPNLMSIAQLRSNDMITRSYFSHTDPRSGQVLFQNLLNDQHYTYLFAGENIAEIRNQGAFVPSGFTVYARYSADELADQFVTGWINSPDHYENIVNSHFRRTGVAVGVSMDGTRIVATQVFSD
jgi:uncharacterized protein YkwD